MLETNFSSSVFQYVADKVVVLIKFWQVIVPATMNTDKCNLLWVYFLQSFTVLNRDQPVAGAMNDIGMANSPLLSIYLCGDDNAGTYLTGRMGKKRSATFRNYNREHPISGSGFIISCNLTGKATANTTTVHNDMLFRICLQ